MNELHGYYLEDLTVGMSASYAKTVTETDIILFAGISGDDNPVHLNAEFADATQFKGRIAHGMLSAAFISTVLGTRLPGPGAIFMSLNIRFNLETVVGQVRVCIFPVLWLDETRTRTAFRYEEQRRQRAGKMCNRICSVLTRWVNVTERVNVNVHAAFQI